VPRALPWIAIVGIGALAGCGLQAAGVLAAWFLGPCIVGVVAGSTGLFAGRMPRRVTVWCQAAIGTLIASTIVPGTVYAVAAHGPALLAAVAATLLAASVAGVVLARTTSLGAATAGWGITPGGAIAMTAMSENYGADARLVAFMQYTRLLVVVFSVSLIAHLMGAGHGVATPLAASVAPRFDGRDFLATAAIALGSTALFLRLGVRSAGLFGPLVVGGTLHALGFVRLTLPPVLLDGAYALVGIGIGLRFTRDTVVHAFRAIPAVLAATVAVMVLCAGSAYLLHRATGIDMLTAYLATSPGGLDSIALVAVGSHADMGLVLALQSLRLVAVVLLGPWIAQRIAASGRRPAPAPG
jgi:membrane AbrB-like protein